MKMQNLLNGKGKIEPHDMITPFDWGWMNLMDQMEAPVAPASGGGGIPLGLPSSSSATPTVTVTAGNYAPVAGATTAAPAAAAPAAGFPWGKAATTVLPYAYDALTNKTKSAKKSGAFPGTEAVAGEYNAYLLDILARQDTDRRLDPEFQRNEALLRDLVTTQTGEARQRLGDTATAEGWWDSGYVEDRMAAIDRSGTEAYARGITELLNQLEARDQAEMDRVFPWLAAAAGEDIDIQHLNIATSLQKREQNLDFGRDLSKEVVDYLKERNSPPTLLNRPR